MKEECADVLKIYMEYIHLSKYSRWMPEENRREFWPETVGRYVEYFKDTMKDKISTDSKTWRDIEKSILKFDVMPSMRSMMTAGTALERDHMAGYNCSAISVTHPRVFDECFYILMCGTGFGFSVERQYIANLPEIAEDMYPTDTVLNVRDSKIGWATALKELISMLYNGQVPTWNLDKVRPAGSRLKVFGGRASGPEPLDRLMNFVVRLFTKAKGRKLNSIECHDLICKIADTVIVGSVRRAACISLSNLTDDRMRRAKMGQWWMVEPQRALANNSVAYTEKPDLDSFSKEWRSIYRSKAGERGIINKEALKNKAESTGREYDGDYVINPCFTGDMKLLTSNGYKTFESMVDTEPDIINQANDVSKGGVWCSGKKHTISLNFRNRESITCTPDHIFMDVEGNEVRAEETKGKRLMPFYSIRNDWSLEEFKAGFIQGDGNTTRLNSPDHKGLEVNLGKNDDDIVSLFNVTDEYDRDVYNREYYNIATKYDLVPECLPERELSGHVMSLDDTTSFLAGLFSANGCVIRKARIALKTTCLDLAHQVKVLLEDIGIDSYITTNKPRSTVWLNGVYTSRESYDLNIGRFDSIIKFANNISFGHGYKRVSLEELILHRSLAVSTITDNGIQKVYDFSEPLTNWGIVEGIVVHNCGEAILRDTGGLCNLTEEIVRPDDTLDDLIKKVKIATIIGTIQATFTDFRYVRKVWKNNAEEERLLGVSLTGIMDHKVMSGTVDRDNKDPNFTELSKWLEVLHEEARKTNKKWAKVLGINPTGHVCLVKPSGTVSQLCNTSSGIHPRYSKHYIRRVRNDRKDPLSQLMIDQGIPYIEEGEKYVFEFPIKSPKHSVCGEDLTALDQLNLWKVYREIWCDGNPSQTIYYTDDEYFLVADWIWNNWDIVGGLSFFPTDDNVYENAPYESINEEMYSLLKSKFPRNIDWLEITKYEKEDSTEAMQTLACTGGACEM